MEQRGETIADAGRVDVVLPAGGRLGGAVAAEQGTDIKALLTVGGQTFLGSTLAALRATGRARRIVVIGPEALAGHPDVSGVDAVLPEGDTGPDNIFRGLDWLRERGDAGRVLVVTTDLPFLTPGALCGFLDACPPDAAVCLPVVRREAFQARFPDSVNQYVPLRDGWWTLGCAFLLDSPALARNRPAIDQAFAARKSQWAMACLLGAPFVTRFLFRQLGIADIERRCGEILGCVGRAVRDAAPELAYDIDLPEHFRYAAHHA